MGTASGFPLTMRFTRQSIINLIRRNGAVVMSARNRALRYIDHPPSSAFHDTLLRNNQSLTGLRFIQIGANDGQRADPLEPFINRYAWTGIMLEPLRANFEALERRHVLNPRLILRRAAVDTQAGRRVVYDLSAQSKASLPDWSRGLGSFSRARLEEVVRELKLPDSAIVEEEVTTISWDEVWKEFGPSRCDLLVLDTEGYDMTLLRAAQLKQHRPKIILFEHACNSISERMGFYRELIELGYDIATHEGDTVASLAA
jgi:FkbM family methyltransferase